MPPAAPDAAAVCQVQVIGTAGQSFSFAAPASRSLLLSAREAGVRLPASCRNGTCRACMCRLLQGQVADLIDWPGLLAEEKAEGWILPCVARPLTDVVIEQTAASPLEPMAGRT
jgi:ferredoxin